MELFEYDYGEDNSPPDNTEICQVGLFLSKEDALEFKKKCKDLMKHYWPTSFIKDGNISDLVLKLLREKHEQTYSQAGTNGQPSRADAQGQLFR